MHLRIAENGDLEVVEEPPHVTSLPSTVMPILDVTELVSMCVCTCIHMYFYMYTFM